MTLGKMDVYSIMNEQHTPRRPKVRRRPSGDPLEYSMDINVGGGRIEPGSPCATDPEYSGGRSASAVIAGPSRSRKPSNAAASYSFISHQSLPGEEQQRAGYGDHTHSPVTSDTGSTGAEPEQDAGKDTVDNGSTSYYNTCDSGSDNTTTSSDSSDDSTSSDSDEESAGTRAQHQGGEAADPADISLFQSPSHEATAAYVNGGAEDKARQADGPDASGTSFFRSNHSLFAQPGNRSATIPHTRGAARNSGSSIDASSTSDPDFMGSCMEAETEPESPGDRATDFGRGRLASGGFLGAYQPGSAVLGQQQQQQQQVKAGAGWRGPSGSNGFSRGPSGRGSGGRFANQARMPAELAEELNARRAMRNAITGAPAPSVGSGSSTASSGAGTRRLSGKAKPGAPPALRSTETGLSSPGGHSVVRTGGHTTTIPSSLLARARAGSLNSQEFRTSTATRSPGSGEFFNANTAHGADRSFGNGTSLTFTSAPLPMNQSLSNAGNSTSPRMPGVGVMPLKLLSFRKQDDGPVVKVKKDKDKAKKERKEKKGKKGNKDKRDKSPSAAPDVKKTSKTTPPVVQPIQSRQEEKPQPPQQQPPQPPLPPLPQQQQPRSDTKSPQFPTSPDLSPTGRLLPLGKQSSFFHPDRAALNGPSPSDTHSRSVSPSPILSDTHRRVPMTQLLAAHPAPAGRSPGGVSGSGSGGSVGVAPVPQSTPPIINAHHGVAVVTKQPPPLPSGYRPRTDSGSPSPSLRRHQQPQHQQQPPAPQAGPPVRKPSQAAAMEDSGLGPNPSYSSTATLRRVTVIPGGARRGLVAPAGPNHRQNHPGAGGNAAAFPTLASGAGLANRSPSDGGTRSVSASGAPTGWGNHGRHVSGNTLTINRPRPRSSRGTSVTLIETTDDRLPSL